MTDEQAFKKKFLERDLLRLLQAFEQETGMVVRAVAVVESDVETHAGQKYHVLTDVKLQTIDSLLT